ncbi:MAG TPA: hypothetical protein VK158_06805 [Acidobacteriota bacterium]|nr:hypothetical protein [Acidobacteriota bacterium]
MGLFGNSLIDTVDEITQFPTIDTIVIRKGKRLVVCNPNYLLGKHGGPSHEVASKFSTLDDERKLMALIQTQCHESDLTGTRIELKEISFPSQVGNDAIVEVPLALLGRLPQEVNHGHAQNIIYIQKGKLPLTKKLNIIIEPYDEKSAPPGLETAFKEKYNITFSDFDAVYAVTKIYAGTFAPPLSDASFWTRHAILKEIQ